MTSRSEPVHLNNHHRNTLRQLFQHLVKQPVQAYSPTRLEELRDSFEKSDFNIQKLVAEIVTTAALHQPSSKNENQVASAR